MKEFIAKYQDEMSGVLTGFDRLVFRGSLRSIACAQGMDKWRTLNGVLRKDFGVYAEKASKRLEEASLAEAKRLGRSIEYLRSSKTDKDELARRIAEQKAEGEGLVCVLRSIEPCASFEVYRNRNEKQLELKSRQRKCMHLYHYQVHPVFGWMSARVQTWFPFSIQICLNGREWLAQQMNQIRSQYARHDNCMVWVEDWQQAQRLLEQQLTGELATVAGWDCRPDQPGAGRDPGRVEGRLLLVHLSVRMGHGCGASGWRVNANTL